jgi:hypothetical protein
VCSGLQVSYHLGTALPLVLPVPAPGAEPGLRVNFATPSPRVHLHVIQLLVQFGKGLC